MNNPNPTMSGDLARIPTRRDAMTMQGQENYLIGITANQWHHVKFTIDMAKTVSYTHLVWRDTMPIANTELETK